MYVFLCMHVRICIFTYAYLFLDPRARLAIMQRRAFSVVGPSARNDLPFELRSLKRRYISLQNE